MAPTASTRSPPTSRRPPSRSSHKRLSRKGSSALAYKRCELIRATIRPSRTSPLLQFNRLLSSIRTSPICSPHPKVGETRFLSLCHTNFPLRPLCNFASVSFCFLSKSIYTCTTERTIHDGFIYEWGPKRMKPGPKEKKAYMPFVSPYCLALFPFPLLLTDIGGSLMNFRGFFFHVLFFSSICHGFLTLYRGQNKSLFFGHLWEGDRSLETEEQQSWGGFSFSFFSGFCYKKDEKREMI